MMDEYISKQQILKKAREHQNSPFGIPVIIAEIKKADVVKEANMKNSDIKEFVRKLKENISVIFIGDNTPMRVVQEVTIDRILKEMEDSR